MTFFSSRVIGLAFVPAAVATFAIVVLPQMNWHQLQTFPPEPGHGAFSQIDRIWDKGREMLWDYDFRLMSSLYLLQDTAGREVALILYRLDSARKSSKPLCERENTQMQACDFDIAASSQPAFQAERRICVSGFSKTMAKTTTKTV